MAYTVGGGAEVEEYHSVVGGSINRLDYVFGTRYRASFNAYSITVAASDTDIIAVNMTVTIAIAVSYR